jgi:hypothetical protein
MKAPSCFAPAMIAGMIGLVTVSALDTFSAPTAPYVGIALRNAFALQHPQPTDPIPLPPESLPKIVLTGITTVLGRPQVLFTVVAPAHHATPVRASSYIMTEGQAGDGVEVLHIEVAAGTAIFRNQGTVQSIPLAAPIPPGRA